MDRAEEHIILVSANLDAEAISTVRKNHAELKKYANVPERATYHVGKNEQDPFEKIVSKVTLAINWPFYTRDALSVWTNLGKHLQFVRLCVSSVKTGTRRIIRLDELSFEMRLERRTSKGSSSERIMRLCL